MVCICISELSYIHNELYDVLSLIYSSSDDATNHDLERFDINVMKIVQHFINEEEVN